MKSSFISDNDGKGFVLAFEGEEVVNIDPIEYYSSAFILREKTITKAFLRAKNAILESGISDQFYQRHAEESWNELKTKIDSTEIPEGLLRVLSADSKKDQEKALRGVGFNYLEFAAFVFKAFTDYEYAFSNYTTEQLPKNIDESEMPEFVHVKEDGTVVSAGGTTYTDKQLRAAVQFRRVVVAKFLDNGKNWHCFFVVYRSLRGEESWQGGQPHFHYISDKWGWSRDEAVSMFKGDSYPSTSVHIAYHE